MVGSSFFSIGCMKRQHAVILESIWEMDSIIIFFPAQRTGLLSPLLTRFNLLSFSLLFGQIVSSPTHFLPVAFLDKNFQSPISSLSSLGTKFSKSNFSSLFSSDQNIVSPTSISQKFSKPIPKSVLAAKWSQPRKSKNSKSHSLSD